jgi:hypothetical protein
MARSRGRTRGSPWLTSRLLCLMALAKNNAGLPRYVPKLFTKERFNSK